MVQLLDQPNVESDEPAATPPSEPPARSEARDLLREMRDQPRRERHRWLLHAVREITGAWTTCLIRVSQKEEASILHLDGSDAPLILEQALHQARRAFQSGQNESGKMAIGRKRLEVPVVSLGAPTAEEDRVFLALAIPLSSTDPEQPVQGMVQLAAALFQEAGQRTRNWEDSFFHRRFVPALAALGLIASVPLLPMPSWVEVSAPLQPSHQRTIPVTWEAPLEKILVQPGDEVKSGQALAELNGDELQRQLAAAIADQARAQKQEEMSTSLGKFVEADLADLEQQRAATRQSALEYQLKHLTLKAPVDGTVIDIPALGREGAWLRQGDPVVVIAGLDHLRVKLEVPAASTHLLPSAGSNDRIRIHLPEGGDDQEAQVLWTGPGLVRIPEGRVLPVILQMDNAAGTLRAGQLAEARLGRDWTPLYRILWTGLKQ